MPLCTTYAQFNQADVFTNAKQAAEKIRLDLTGFSPALVIFFASTAYDPATIAAEMHKTFPNAITVGCTSS
ncbi:MAG: hypothetical protein LIP23_07945, partial [Planctomycetes bacterium]|nr:hypothetical protein [Planctomycetota bacterium]